VIYSCYWSSPAQYFWGLSPAELISIFYYLFFFRFPKLEGRVPVFISPQEKGSPVVPPGIGFFSMTENLTYLSLYILGSGRRENKISSNSTFVWLFVQAKKCLLYRFLINDVFTEFDIPAFIRHITV
jgi:hypothetical protein